MKAKINWKAIEEQILYEAPDDTGEGDGDLQASDYGDTDSVEIEDIGPEDYTDAAEDEAPVEDTGGEGEDAPMDDEAPVEGNPDEDLNMDENPDDMGEDMGEENPEEAPEESTDTEDAEKNEYLIRDFIELKNRIEEIIKKVDEDARNKFVRNPVLAKAKENLSKLDTVVHDYIVDRFNKEEYLTNLYQFNLIIQAINVNCDLLEKGLRDEEEEKKKKKKSNNRKK